MILLMLLVLVGAQLPVLGEPAASPSPYVDPKAPSAFPSPSPRPIVTPSPSAMPTPSTAPAPTAAPTASPLPTTLSSPIPDLQDLNQLTEALRELRVLMGDFEQGVKDVMPLLEALNQPTGTLDQNRLTQDAEKLLKMINEMIPRLLQRRTQPPVGTGAPSLNADMENLLRLLEALARGLGAGEGPTLTPLPPR